MGIAPIQVFIIIDHTDAIREAIRTPQANERIVVYQHVERKSRMQPGGFPVISPHSYKLT